MPSPKTKPKARSENERESDSEGADSGILSGGGKKGGGQANKSGTGSAGPEHGRRRRRRTLGTSRRRRRLRSRRRRQTGLGQDGQKRLASRRWLADQGRRDGQSHGGKSPDGAIRIPPPSRPTTREAPATTRRQPVAGPRPGRQRQSRRRRPASPRPRSRPRVRRSPTKPTSTMPARRPIWRCRT